MFLLSTLTIVNEWFSLFANIATCIASISVVIGLIVLTKNRFSRKTFQVKLNFLHIGKEYITCSMDFLNFTDKELSIIECNLLLENEKYIMESRSFDQDIQISIFEDYKNINISPHQSITLDYVYFHIANSAGKKAVLEVKTTQKTLIYKVSIPTKIL